MLPTFGGQPCLDPAELRRTCLNTTPPLPIDWFGKVNKFENVAGHLPGTGGVLMMRSHLKKLDVNDAHDLTFFDHDGTPRTLKNLIISGPTTCLDYDTRNPLSDTTAHFVPIADARQIWQLYPINRAYNIRTIPTANYNDEWSTDETTPLTFAEMWANLWGRLPEEWAGDVPTLPTITAYTGNSPRNFSYWGWTLPNAMGHFLDRLGFSLVWNPFDDAWKVVDLGGEQLGLASAETKLFNTRRHLWDIEPIAPSLGSIPRTVHVYFRKTPGPRAYGQSPFYVVEVGAPNPINDGEQGAVIIHDDMLAIYQATILTNGSECNLRANERATTFFQEQREYQRDPMRKVYSGAIDAILPGEKIESVTLLDAGSGMLTETRRRPKRDPQGEWPGNEHQPWRLVEVIKIDPVVSGSVTPPTDYFSGRINVLNPSTDLYEVMATVWWKGMNGETPAEGFRYLSRYKGSKANAAGEVRPVYVGGCCEGSESPPGDSGGGTDPDPCDYPCGDNDPDANPPFPEPPVTPPATNCCPSVTICSNSPPTMYLTMSGTGGFVCLSTLTLSTTGFAPGGSTCNTGTWGPQPDCPFSMQITAFYDEGDTPNCFTLQVAWPLAGCEGGGAPGGTFLDGTVISCSPLIVEFGPMPGWATCHPGDEISFTVTDVAP